MFKNFFSKFFDKKEKRPRPDKTEEEKKEELRKLKEEVRQYLKEQGYKGNIKIVSSEEPDRGTKQTNNQYFVNHSNNEIKNESPRIDGYDPIKQMNDSMYQDDTNCSNDNSNDC